MEKKETKFVDNTPIDGYLSGTPKNQNIIKQKSHSPELISRPLVTTASQENDAAKIQNKSITTKTLAIHHLPLAAFLTIAMMRRRTYAI